MTHEIADELIDVPSRPPIDGLRFRRYRGEADLPGMAAANNTARVAYGMVELVDVDAMRNDYANLTNSDPREDILVIELEGRIVGYCRVAIADQTDGSVSIDSVCPLEPELRGRGIGSAVMDWIEGRVRVLGPQLPRDRERWLTVFNLDADTYAARLFQRRRFRPTRHFYEMIRPNLDDVPDAPLPGGFEIRPVTREDLRRIWEADVEMFRDHWGETDESEAAFRRFAGDPRLDPSLFIVAFDGNVIAAHVLNIVDEEANRIHGVRHGILDSVGTRREYRRRGLARALICRSLRLLRERGLDGATLGVDVDNSNRALALYESCGFVTKTSSTDWRRPVDDILEAAS